MATGSAEALGAALALTRADAEALGEALDPELHAIDANSASTSPAPVTLAKRVRAASRGLIEALLVIDSSSFVMRPPGVAQHNADHRNSGDPRPGGRRHRYRGQVSVCSLLSLLPASTACARRTENAPVSTETRPAVSASTPEPEPQARQAASAARARVFSVGQPAVTAAYTLRVRRVLECSGKGGWRPEPDRLFLGVELEAVAGSESVAIGHSHVKLRYGDTHTLAAEPFVETQDCTPLLRYTRLGVHERVQGWVVFSIPKSASSLELHVGPRQFLNDQATLFDLGR